MKYINKYSVNTKQQLGKYNLVLSGIKGATIPRSVHGLFEAAVFSRGGAGSGAGQHSQCTAARSRQGQPACVRVSVTLLDYM